MSAKARRIIDETDARQLISCLALGPIEHGEMPSDAGIDLFRASIRLGGGEIVVSVSTRRSETVRAAMIDVSESNG